MPPSLFTPVSVAEVVVDVETTLPLGLTPWWTVMVVAVVVTVRVSLLPGPSEIANHVPRCP